ncbi:MULTISPECIES: hypothetical protein [Pseudomonas]|uniref:hypothetical protein n=1 Tax=Pseudomonas TaxID=286 RepID=UPI000F5A4A62|nr:MULTISPECIES: hypothetical protein [Pseudomonas]MBC8784358.1 hypothetical protein [Pseudomonas fluorescens]RQO49187.1 hypothetical protein DBR46_24475 [Pseudomonas sp. KBW05]
MTVNVDLTSREIARRKALWTLAHLIPGDSRADGIIEVLDEIALQEHQDASLPPPHVNFEELRGSVTVEAHPIGVSIVRESSIPQPWRERFLRASIGSTRVTEGPYATDWHSFLEHWVSEMQHLESHRAFLRSRN